MLTVSAEAVARATVMSCGAPQCVEYSHSLSKKSFEDAIETWPVLRRQTHRVITSFWFDTAIGVVIMFNVFVIVAETDMGANCRLTGESCRRAWVEASNGLLLVIYTLEAVARVYVFRKNIKNRPWDLFDISNAILCYLDLLVSLLLADAQVPGLQLLRIVRVGKVLRIIRGLRMFPELFALFQSFLSAMTTMFWGFIMIMTLLLLTAILTVEFIQPISIETFDEDDDCFSAYNTVFEATIYFFQTLMAGDAWGQCTLPIIHKSHATACFFVVSLVLIQLGTINLIMAVVIQKAQEAHANDVETKLNQITMEKKRAESRLNEFCEAMDNDQNGTIGLDELKDFYQSSAEMREVFDTLDMTFEDCESLFNLMDKDHSGDLSYQELVNCIGRANSNDIPRHVMSMKLMLQDIWDGLKNHGFDSMMLLVEELDKVLKGFSPQGLAAAARPKLKRLSCRASEERASRSEFEMQRQRSPATDHYLVSSEKIQLPEDAHDLDSNEGSKEEEDCGQSFDSSEKIQPLRADVASRNASRDEDCEITIERMQSLSAEDCEITIERMQSLSAEVHSAVEALSLLAQTLLQSSEKLITNLPRHADDQSTANVKFLAREEEDDQDSKRIPMDGLEAATCNDGWICQPIRLPFLRESHGT
eukprot:TRINITY_DN5941_c0_g1_i3.p1 TRINITY_DN5941_c0_g1~~TRINITY_DN5941_c0_g1_i3.p1  ORF type:complete len:647 (+),score=121.09 TRINITY_DN5941_c0_g1_i3:39-1979(+)